VALTDEPPRPAGSYRVVWTRLCAISGLVEGSMLKGALESQGIHVLLISFDIPAYAGVRVDWSLRDWGELRVPEEEEVEARSVLEDFVRAVSRIELEPGSDPGSEPGTPEDLTNPK
jgi:hypothetical protein